MVSHWGAEPGIGVTLHGDRWPIGLNLCTDSTLIGGSSWRSRTDTRRWGSGFLPADPERNRSARDSGAYEPGRSDFDVALVCEDALNLGLKQKLVTRLRHEAFRAQARGLELCCTAVMSLRPGHSSPGSKSNSTRAPGITFRATFAGDDRPAADGRFWHGLDRSFLHQSGYVMLGPPASEMFVDLHPPTSVRSWSTRFDGGLSSWRHRTVSRPLGRRTPYWGACRSLVRIRHGVCSPRMRRVVDCAMRARRPS